MRTITSAAPPLALPRATVGVALSYVVVALTALLLRLLDLGAYVTADEVNFWLRRSERFIAFLLAGDYGATAMTSHPGVTTMWLGGFGFMVQRQLTQLGLLPIAGIVPTLVMMRIPIVIVHTVAILVGYRLLRRMLTPATAFLAALLWATDPFHIGYSRLLHTDALAATFATLSLLAACCYWNHERARRFLVLSAICGGLAMLSKSPATALLPVFGAIGMLALRAERCELSWRNIRTIVVPVISWAAIAVAILFTLWPALWVAPAEALAQLREGVEIEGAQPHMLGNYYLGQPDDAPGPLFYTTALALRTTPLTLLGLLALAIQWPNVRQRALRRDLAALALFAIVFLIAMSIFPKKFNRYLLPIFPALDIIAAVGLLQAVDLVGRALFQRPPQYLARAVVAVVLAMGAIGNAASWHPYGVAAYNQLLGGAPAGAYAFSVGWGEGLEQVAAWLNEQDDITGVVVASTQVRTLQPYLRSGAQAETPTSDTFSPETGYVVVYVRDAQPAPLPPFARYFGRSAPAHVVRIHGVEYAWIYQVAPRVPRLRPADFGKTLFLRGYALERDGAELRDLSLKLFWRVRQAAPIDYTLFVHLIGPDGMRYAQADLPYPTSDWRPGQFVTTEVPLLVPDDAPPGSYRLLLGLYDSTNGVRLDLTSPFSVDERVDGPDALPLGYLRFE